MSGRHSQVTRILEVISLLEVNPQGLTVDEIYERVKTQYSVDKRSIYRDIEALEASAFPVFQEVDSDDNRIKRWKMNKTLNVTKSLILSPRELVGLYLAKSTLEPLKETPFYQDLESIFQKVENLLGPKAHEYLKEISQGIHFEPSPRWGLGIAPEVIDVIRAGCDEGHLISVEYQSQNSGDCRRRTLGPHFLYFAKGSVYLIAEDMENHQVKTFSLPRMKNPEMLPEAYHGTPVDPNEYFNSALGVYNGGAPEVVKLHFTPKLAQFVRERRWHHSQQVVPMSDGSLKMTLHLSLTMEVVNWILSFGEHVKVVEPLRLQTMLVASAEEILKLYSKNRAA